MTQISSKARSVYGQSNCGHFSLGVDSGNKLLLLEHASPARSTDTDLHNACVSDSTEPKKLRYEAHILSRCLKSDGCQINLPQNTKTEQKVDMNTDMTNPTLHLYQTGMA